MGYKVNFLHRASITRPEAPFYVYTTLCVPTGIVEPYAGCFFGWESQIYKVGVPNIEKVKKFHASSFHTHPFHILTSDESLPPCPLNAVPLDWCRDTRGILPRHAPCILTITLSHKNNMPDDYDYMHVLGSITIFTVMIAVPTLVYHWLGGPYWF